MRSNGIYREPIERLRGGGALISGSTKVLGGSKCGICSIGVSNVRGGRFEAIVSRRLVLRCGGKEFRVRFADRSGGSMSTKEKVHCVTLSSIASMRVLMSRSSIRIFIGSKRTMFSAQFCPGTSDLLMRTRRTRVVVCRVR